MPKEMDRNDPKCLKGPELNTMSNTVRPTIHTRDGGREAHLLLHHVEEVKLVLEEALMGRMVVSDGYGKKKQVFQHCYCIERKTTGDTDVFVITKREK